MPQTGHSQRITAAIFILTRKSGEKIHQGIMATATVGSLDLTIRAQQKMSALGLTAATAAIYAKSSPTEIRRWLAGTPGSQRKLEIFYQQLTDLETFKNSCPQIPLDLSRALDVVHLRRRIEEQGVEKVISELKDGWLRLTGMQILGGVNPLHEETDGNA